MRFATTTLGCKVNFYDTQAMSELLVSHNYTQVDFDEFSDVYLINTCTVTNNGDKKSRQMIKKAKKQNPKAIVIVCGCYAQTSPKIISQIDGVDIIIGTDNRLKIVDILNDYKSANTKETLIFVNNIMSQKSFEHLKIQNFSEKTRAYLKIQEGCNQFCSYCIIPFSRGNARSRNPEEVFDEALRLSENGFKEIVLSGVHIASYGKDLHDITLLDIIKKIAQIPNIERIRFSSIEPSIITQNFVNTIKNLEKVCPHIHLSLQSGCDKTLKNMNRKYSTKQYEESVDILRKHFEDISITTDIIVGFPEESDECFDQSYSFCEKMELSKIHIFPFSPKKGTKAYDMKQISSKIKSERTQKFLILDENLQKKFILKNLNKVKPTLFEKLNQNGFYEGYTSNYINIKAQSNKNILNKIFNIKLTNIDGLSAIGQFVDYPG